MSVWCLGRRTDGREINESVLVKDHYSQGRSYYIARVDHWGDLGVDGWIILDRISRRWDVGIWAGLGWLRIETGGGRL